MNWHDECRRLHYAACETRAAQSYTEGSIPFLLRPFLDEAGEVHKDFPLTSGVDNQMRRIFKVLSLVFREQQIPALIIQSDTRRCNLDEFVKYFKIPGTLPIDKQLDEYSRILVEQFDGELVNLPRELWSDAICTGLKGPRIIPLSLHTEYRQGDRDRVVLEPTQDNWQAQWNVFPDWWGPGSPTTREFINDARRARAGH